MSTQTKSRTAVYLSPRLAGTLMTPEEFDAARRFKDGYRYELVHGVLVVSPPPLPTESDANEELGHWLRDFWELHPGVMDATVPQHYMRTQTSRRIADRAIWVGLGRLPNHRRDVPTIVVEFVSRSRRDRQRDYEDKRQEYMAVGIAEYWIIDRFRRTLTAVRPERPDQVVPETAAFTTPHLPGFEPPLAKLLAVADRWAKRKG
ncbi:MAG TPA: Uma2 family endonuclease [Gemmataceae bacterium]|nr:Uma2 family endonuclease [Gemmataceae bacterium]